jgi:5-formyltetrahydrofolate cyclo-ligase
MIHVTLCNFTFVFFAMAKAFDKTAARRAALARRDQLTTDERADLSERIGAHVWAAIARHYDKSLLVTLPIGSEWDSRQVAHNWLQLAGRVILPRVVAGRAELALYWVEDLERQCTVGHWGLCEPVPALCAAVLPDAVGIVIVPGLAFDDRGYRIGYGRGYFDRLLASAPQAQRLGAGYALQRVQQVPTDPWDHPVHAYISENGREDFAAA